jgi:hypothetical protein
MTWRRAGFVVRRATSTSALRDPAAVLGLKTCSRCASRRTGRRERGHTDPGCGRRAPALFASGLSGCSLLRAAGHSLIMVARRPHRGGDILLPVAVAAVVTRRCRGGVRSSACAASRTPCRTPCARRSLTLRVGVRPFLRALLALPEVGDFSSSDFP